MLHLLHNATGATVTVVGAFSENWQFSVAIFPALNRLVGMAELRSKILWLRRQRVTIQAIGNIG